MYHPYRRPTRCLLSRAFHLHQPRSIAAAITTAAGGGACIAGGTDLMQFMKDDVETPDNLVDPESLPLIAIRHDVIGLRLAAMARMSDAAAHPDVTAHYSAISQALPASASPHVRNMGTMGGNLLPRSRCVYFRDTGFPACRKHLMTCSVRIAVRYG